MGTIAENCLSYLSLISKSKQELDSEMLATTCTSKILVTTQAMNSPPYGKSKALHPLAPVSRALRPTPKLGEGEPNPFKVPLPAWERDLG